VDAIDSDVGETDVLVCSGHLVADGDDLLVQLHGGWRARGAVCGGSRGDVVGCVEVGEGCPGDGFGDGQ